MLPGHKKFLNFPGELFCRRGNNDGSDAGSRSRLFQQLRQLIFPPNTIPSENRSHRCNLLGICYRIKDLGETRLSILISEEFIRQIQNSPPWSWGRGKSGPGYWGPSCTHAGFQPKYPFHWTSVSRWSWSVWSTNSAL